VSATSPNHRPLHPNPPGRPAAGAVSPHRRLLAAAQVASWSHLARRLVVVTVMIAAAWWVVDARSAAEVERGRWADGSSVWVVRAPVAAGDTIGADDIELVEVPTALHTDEMLSPDMSPAGERARVDLVPGEAVAASRLHRDAASAVAARLPHATRGVAVHLVDDVPLELGGRADLHDLGDGRVIARDVPVVDRSDTATTFAVPSDAVDDVVSAGSTAGVTAVIRD